MRSSRLTCFSGRTTPKYSHCMWRRDSVILSLVCNKRRRYYKGSTILISTRTLSRWLQLELVNALVIPIFQGFWIKSPGLSSSMMLSQNYHFSCCTTVSRNSIDRYDGWPLQGVSFLMHSWLVGLSGDAILQSQP